MEASDTLTDVVISTLKQRDLLVKRDVIASAFSDPATSHLNAEWVSKHLRADSLLSREELTLYSRLESSGSLQVLLRDPDLSATRPFLEDDIRSAIESLEASTAAIQKQTATLESQCGQLDKHFRLENNLVQDRSRDIAKLRKKHEVGRQNITTAANELLDELEANFKNATDKAGAENKKVLSSLSTRLKQDDKTLSSLETLMNGVKSHSNDASTAKQVTQLSGLLADYVAEEIHYRLDRLYLGLIQKDESELNRDLSKNDETIAALEEELEALYPEIEVLAEMSSKQQFNEPILREIQNEHGQTRAMSQQKLNQALDILIDMTLSKQALTRRLKDRESSCEVLEQLASLYQEEVGNQLATQPPSRRESLRRRSLQPGVFLSKPLKSNAAAEQPALESLMRRLGVSPESILRPRAEDGGAWALHEKRIHMSESSKSLGATVEPLAAHLAPADMASQLLISSVHANSHFETSVPDASQEGALSELESALGRLQKGMQRINVDAIHQRDKAHDKFMERWT